MELENTEKMDRRSSKKLRRRRMNGIGSSFVWVTALIAIFGVFSAAQSDDFDDFIEALNQLIIQEGPFPGQIADPLPEDQLAEEMAAARAPSIVPGSLVGPRVPRRK